MKEDPTIERIRKVRHQISAECDHDPKKLLARYRQMEKRYEDRMLRGEHTQSTAR